ncbi:MAG: hypothetical protein ABI635_09920 [Actinomycetota bacterium]
MRTSIRVALMLVTLASCTGVPIEEGVSPSTSTRSPSPSGDPATQLTECRGLRAPLVELDTNLDRTHGLFSVHYTIQGQNRSFTIAYHDPSCRKNPETRQLLRNADVWGSGG